jgi:hypothetical protein
MITLPKQMIFKLDDICIKWGWNRSDVIFSLLDYCIDRLEEVESIIIEEAEEVEDEEED